MAQFFSADSLIGSNRRVSGPGIMPVMAGGDQRLMRRVTRRPGFCVRGKARRVVRWRQSALPTWGAALAGTADPARDGGQLIRVGAGTDGVVT